eukprot:PITA_08052
MASSGKIEIEKFNGRSFELWKLKMEDLLLDKDEWIMVDLGTKPTGVSDEEWKKLDRKAKITMRLCVSDSVLLNVSREATVKTLWDKLRTLYQSKSLVNKLFLWKKLYNLRMKDGDSLIEHLNAFNPMVSQLAFVNIKISDEDKCISLFCSLPDLWDSLVIAIGSNATALHFDEIVSSLLKEEMRRKNMERQNGDALSMRTLYKLQGSTVVDGCNSYVVPESGAKNLVVSGEKTMLWHQRLGHIGWKGLRILHGKGMVEGMNNSSLGFDFCENCVYGKQNRVSFPSREKKIKALRTDNGGEFYNKEFEEFYKKCGIARQKTTPYTPQQNGVAERMNKTLMEKTRSMLSGARLRQEFWAEAVDTTCYLVNRSPSSALEDKTPQEVWTGKKPSLSHLRGYKLWNPVTRKVVYSRDVVFREVKDVIKHEVQPKEPEKIEFELKEEESDYNRGGIRR